MYELEDTYHWLSSEIYRFPYTLDALVDKARSAARKGDFSIACQYLGEIKAGRSLADEPQQALLHIECARAACQMHNRIQAEGEIKDAITQLTKGNADDLSIQHALALAYWMLGNLTLPFSNTPQEITATWGKSLQIFERLASHPEIFRSQRNWYLDRCAEMRQAIREAIIASPCAPTLPQACLYAGRLKSIPWVDSIPPRGLLDPGAAASQIEVYLDPFSTSFRIAEKPHNLYNLRGNHHPINLEFKHTYFIIKVQDDRLDKIGIMPGDYVLVRQQVSAQNGDIVVARTQDPEATANMDYVLMRQQASAQNGDVAARIQGPEAPATLSTYLIRGGNEGFHPQSTNPGHPILEFTPSGTQKYTIDGVAIGVFKASTLPPGSPETSQEDLQPIPFSDFIRSLPVYVEIPAGGFAKIPEKTGSYLEINRAWIDGQAYLIRNLRRTGHAINLTSGEVIVLKVTGDSMNRVNIQSGDYVLLRRQDSAEDNDIVAAEIHDVDQRATLKVFRRRGTKAVLQPQSTDPKYTEFEFDLKNFPKSPGEKPFYIRGVALAVLKPL